MNQLSITNTRYNQLIQGFREWLDLTGYASTSVYSMPRHIQEFLHYLEQEQKPLENLFPEDINTYFFHLSNRRNKRTGKALSNNYLHKYLQAIKNFNAYLKETEQGGFDIDTILPNQKSKIPEVLTKEEVKKLYAVCTGSPIGLRDRAMLSIYYGCGLRRNEGIQLELSDFMADKKLLYVRKGKGYKERYVPFTEETGHDIQEYINYGRSSQVKNFTEQSLLLSERGTKISGQSLVLRLKQLLTKAEINKDIGLHTLRHSIATHLLESGMKLQNIARFLGHQSLESTQIYTHIINEL